MNEILKVEQKYAQLKRPLFTSRNERLSKIPGFWPTAIKNHPILHQLLCPMDEEILNNLVEVRHTVSLVCFAMLCSWMFFGDVAWPERPIPW